MATTVGSVTVIANHLPRRADRVAARGIFLSEAQVMVPALFGAMTHAEARNALVVAPSVLYAVSVPDGGLM
jgi:hypothetical protein